ncbi:hypothetical protein CDL12_21339 [Handroanthus impetiginosus]|uniref:Non-specific serine/threonine protein kinase n=1 Tax=Handroanthus impetiginosus TaxID=429701 RepID=A0A2G9GM64_9LAMI|nr:hypothetical protein CDL12_21339 [Handroanthus impetiginosus]
MSRFIVYYLFLILVNAHLILGEEKQVIRKLGKHSLDGKIGALSQSPAESPKSEFSREAASAEESTGAGAQEEVMKTNHHHRSIDKSVAGGGVILGGLAAVFLAAVFCYIRATGRKAAEPGSPTSSVLSIGGQNGELGSPTK